MEGERNFSNFVRKMRRVHLHRQDDPIQKAIGDFGIWQLPIVFMMFVYKLSLGWHSLASIFLMPYVQVVCDIPNVTDPCSAECPGHKYNDSVFASTVTSQWDLVCDRMSMSIAAEIIIKFGNFAGSIGFGILSDRIGRKIPLRITIVGLIATGVVTPFVHWFWLFTFIRFLNGVAAGGGFSVSFVYMMEIVGHTFRTVLGITFSIPFFMGHLTLPIFSYFLRNWQDYQMAYSIASGICLPCLFINHDSPRWLYSTGQVKEAAKILTEAAKVNRLPTEHLEERLQAAYNAKIARPPKKGRLIHLFRTRKWRIKTVCISYIWFASVAGFYGLLHGTRYLKGNIFENVATSACLEIPATVICVLSTKYWGRKPTQMIAHLITGSAIIAIACLYEEDGQPIVHTIILILVAICSFGISIAFANAYLYAAELFPTVVRNAGMGAAAMTSRIGSIMTPFIANIEPVWVALLIYAFIAIIAAALCILLPETGGVPLLETLQNIDDFESLDT